MKKQKMSIAQKKEAMWSYLFVAPTIIGLVVLNIYPIFNTIYQSFFKTGDFGKGNIFNGVDNYIRLLSDGEIWQAFWNTIKYAIIEVPFGIAIALVLALYLSHILYQPLKQLTLTMEKVSEGDLQTRARIESRDEIGELAMEFNDMLDKMNRGMKRNAG